MDKHPRCGAVLQLADKEQTADCRRNVPRYELQPEQGVKVSKIVGLSDDIKLNLAVADLRIEAPIPGKAAVGIDENKRGAGKKHVENKGMVPAL